jgi:glycosyltransferase involved in cell wall biosynthesis
LQETSKDIRFAFSTACIGEDISKNKLVMEADIIHLHWVNQGFISLNGIEKLLKLNKPVVWTLHDMWAFTGGCHYSNNCNHFMKECGNCHFLKNPSSKDISHKIWMRKNEIFKKYKNITFVACSYWLQGIAKTSSLLQNFRIESIPNPINTEIFKPGVYENIVQKLNLALCKKYILFGAANVSDKRKGLQYFIDALNILKDKYPEIVYKVELIIFGKNKDINTIFNNSPFRINNIGQLNTQEEIAEVYSVANVFVLPSIEDNLPNTIMEALASGTAVVAFNTGGIPEMIDEGLNGFIAEYKSSQSLANKIYKILFESDNQSLSSYAREKVINNYNEKLISTKYFNLYKEIIQ